MEIGGASTAIMLLVATVLWFAYLVPTWVRRREYLATERNATRLQQTIRIMAETAEAPPEVRVELNARGAAETARMLHAAEKERERARAERERAALAELSARRDPLVVKAETARLRARRTRLVATLVLFAGVALAIVQIGMMLGTGVTPGSVIGLGIAALAVSSSLGIHRRLNIVRRRVPAVRETAAPVARRTASSSRQEAPAAPERRVAEWTPVPVPKPLYLSRPEYQSVAPTADAERLMREAAAAAEKALRAAHAEPEVVAFARPSTGQVAASVSSAASSPGSTSSASPSATPSSVSASPAAPPAPAAPPSRWASMGIVDPAEATTPDLDEVLRRRRAAG